MEKCKSFLRRNLCRMLLAMVLAAGAVGLTPAAGQAISGGYTDSGGLFPYVARIVYTPTGRLCTSAVIHPLWVLTAAHCVPGASPNTLTVLIGNTLQGAGGQNRGVDRVLTQPGYVVGGHNDVALLHLDLPAYVPRVRLASPADSYAWDGVDDIGYATGWGLDAAGATPTQRQYRRVDIKQPTVDGLGIPMIPVSAGPCEGDSGGPLLVPANGGGYLEVGVLKAGTCGSSANYSEVGEGGNRDWIRTQIPDLDRPHIGLPAHPI
ncbi:S1 family peptidase [Streptomyces sp. NPDC007896]|uniref:S1 family peptidase n=1 Tax=Streptomyces sp. NPDC007896 TaxID=3364784 RepID=UPI0036E3D4BD